MPLARNFLQRGGGRAVLRGARTVTHAMRPAAPAPESATPERPPPLEATHGGPSPAYRDFVPPPASEDGLSELFAEAKVPSVKPLAPTASDSTKDSDIAANGAKNEGEVIILTFALFYACLPPSYHEELQSEPCRTRPLVGRSLF